MSIKRWLGNMRQPNKDLDYGLYFEDTPNAVILGQWIKHTVTRKRKSNEDRTQAEKRSIFKLKGEAGRRTS